MQAEKMKVEIWSDIMCPFCYIGKRHYEAALQKFPEAASIITEWKSYQLDPSIPEEFVTPVPVYDYLAERKGITRQQSEDMHKNVTEMAKRAGLHYDFDKVIVANSLKAHCVIQLAKTKGLDDQMEEIFFRAYFTEGRNLGDIPTLIALGKEAGLEEKEVKEALVNESYAFRVDADVSEAKEIGVRGVPFFVFNRKYAISGAQPVEAFLQTLEKSFSEWKKEQF
jgi:protein disulfide-isomerase